jgi:hypothetical protein
MNIQFFFACFFDFFGSFPFRRSTHVQARLIKAELIIKNQQPWVDEKLKPMVLT